MVDFWKKENERSTVVKLMIEIGPMHSYIRIGGVRVKNFFVFLKASFLQRKKRMRKIGSIGKESRQIEVRTCQSLITRVCDEQVI